MHLQQTTFENIVAKGEMAHDEQFHLLSQSFQLYLIIKLSFMEIFHAFANMYFEMSTVDLLYVESVKLCFKTRNCISLCQ